MNEKIITEGILPSGVVTFIFTDIEGSTKLAQEHPESLNQILHKHNTILRQSIESNNGFVYDVIGDSFQASFYNDIDAIRAARDAQIKLFSEDWGDMNVRVRMGIHKGPAEWNGEKYMGYITLARTNRIMSAACGGQILLSDDVYKTIEEKPHGFIFKDLGERRLKDLIKPLQIFQLVTDSIQSDFPPLKTLDARPNNLPVQLTSFIGRDAEIENVKELIRRSRLLTLTGMGGVGKTRLAMQTVADLIDENDNGVWIVDLAPVSDPQQVPFTIMQTLRIKDELNIAAVDTVLNHLENKQMIMILDNCEHLIAKVAEIVESILMRCGKVKIVATSREELKCSGELVHAVGPLSAPDPASEYVPEELVKFESVRLFIERALAVDNNFRVNSPNANALAKICHKLDGIPLAIELAASRVKNMTVEKISERLEDRFRLLNSGRRTSLPRQQTLKALVDWSYDLLDEQERILWRRMSVFVSAYSLESIEGVCAFGEISNESILDMLSSLVEKSIVIFDTNSGYYKMLETIKYYGLEKLTLADENRIVYDRHLEFFKTFINDESTALNSAKKVESLNNIERNNLNIIQALEWSVKSGRTLDEIAIISLMSEYWHIRGYHSEARELFESVIDRSKGIRNRDKANVLRRYGYMLSLMGQHEEAQCVLEESLELYKESGDDRSIAACLNNLGLAAHSRGLSDVAIEYYTQSLKIREMLDDKKGMCASLNGLGIVTFEGGEYEIARDYFERSLSIAREIGDREGVGINLNNLGNIYIRLRDYENAQKSLEESLSIMKEFGNKWGISISLLNLGSVASNTNDLVKAKQFFAESLTMKQNTADKIGIVYATNGLAKVALKEGDIELSSKLYIENLTRLKDHYDTLTVAGCIIGVAEALVRDKKFDNALLIISITENRLMKENISLESDLQEQLDFVKKILDKNIPPNEILEIKEKAKELSVEDVLKMLTAGTEFTA